MLQRSTARFPRSIPIPLIRSPGQNTYAKPSISMEEAAAAGWESSRPWRPSMAMEAKTASLGVRKGQKKRSALRISS
jgi:hypothetical protein